jgi:hypothetical protein
MSINRYLFSLRAVPYGRVVRAGMQRVYECSEVWVIWSNGERPVDRVPVGRNGCSRRRTSAMMCGVM